MPLGAARAVVIRATASTPGSTGFVIASAGANVNDGGSTAWTSPGNITAQDAVRATCNRTTNGTSQLLYATFNLSAIPADATDFKFIVRVRRDYSTVTPPQQIRDSAIRLTLDGSTMVGDNKADTGLDWPQATDTNKDYGSSSDAWGITPTAAQVKAAAFGVMVKAALTISGGASTTARVDTVWIDVHYLA